MNLFVKSYLQIVTMTLSLLYSYTYFIARRYCGEGQDRVLNRTSKCRCPSSEYVLVYVVLILLVILGVAVLVCRQLFSAFYIFICDRAVKCGGKWVRWHFIVSVCVDEYESAHEVAALPSRQATSMFIQGVKERCSFEGSNCVISNLWNLVGDEDLPTADGSPAFPFIPETESLSPRLLLSGEGIGALAAFNCGLLLWLCTLMGLLYN